MTNAGATRYAEGMEPNLDAMIPSWAGMVMYGLLLALAAALGLIACTYALANVASIIGTLADCGRGEASLRNVATSSVGLVVPAVLLLLIWPWAEALAALGLPVWAAQSTLSGLVVLAFLAVGFRFSLR